MKGLVRTGRPTGTIAPEFECSSQAIRNWGPQTDLGKDHRSDGLMRLECVELQRPRRENQELRGEREILKRATAW